MEKLSMDQYHTLRDTIRDMSIFLWRHLDTLMDQLDAKRKDTLLQRLYLLTTGSVYRISWVVWGKEPKICHMVACELMDLLDGYFDVQEISDNFPDNRKAWVIKRIPEED